LKAADDQVGDAPRLKKIVQTGTEKRVRSGLPHVNIATASLKSWREVPTVCSVVHVTTFCLMLDDNYEGAGLTCLAGNPIDSTDDAIDIVRHVLAGRQNLLDVDDKESGGHGLEA
jgi:hypothetical protein